MSLGDKLREARINKGYTLNTMQQMTKIQKKYLQAIEEEKYDEMPGTFYVRAFIKQYADVVGLNGDDLLEQYEKELDLDNEQEDAVAATGGDSMPKRSELTGSDEKNTVDVILSYMPMILLVAIIIIIIATLLYAINTINQDDTDVAPESSQVTSVVSLVDPNSNGSEVTETTEDEEAPTQEVELQEGQQRVGDQVITLVSGTGEAPVFELSGAMSDYTFEVEGISFVWAGVLEDGIMVVDQTINADESVEYQTADTTSELTLARGYPEGANFIVNGTEVELPEGQFIESITFVAGDGSQDVTSDESVPAETESVADEAATPAEGEAEATEGTTTEEPVSYEGPAVFDPSNE
ncbi:helix-turn-helix domain-containing protein [Aerococcaceae bacterium DSM 111176]|nr:helix-turn-helix domain-containing protein [Aerococcaceae bacterium DSM 111176]